MVWAMMKSRLSKTETKTKEDLINGIEPFWKEDMNIALCYNFIDHIYKVLPIAVLVNGRASPCRPGC